MWALRTFGWTVMAMGIVALLAIPFLAMAGRGDEVLEAIGVGALAILVGFAIVRYLTRPER
jgi:hypothetical protein